jgi:hypothetical protein
VSCVFLNIASCLAEGRAVRYALCCRAICRETRSKGRRTQLRVTDVPTSAYFTVIPGSVALTATTFRFGATSAYVAGTNGKIIVYRLAHYSVRGILAHIPTIYWSFPVMSMPLFLM